jgi:subtilisin family serine protease
MRGGLAMLALGMLGLATAGSAAEVATEHILVKFKSDEVAARALSRAAGLRDLAATLDLPAGAELREPAVNALLRSKDKTAVDALNLDRFLYLDLPSGLSVEEAIRRVSESPRVEYAEPDGIGTGGATPDDPDYASQWHHANATTPSASIQTPLAWDITTGSTNVILAVLDTGLTSTMDFTNRTVAGYNFAYMNADTTDDHGHGTAVAGVAAATGNNATRVAGVDWNCRILPVKVLNSGNSGLYSWWAQGVDFAVANGAKIINLSAGGSTTSATLTAAITSAIAQGVIFVTITHNDGSGTIRYPGRLTNCITVGATDTQDRRAVFSNYGSQIDLCAPGTNIYTVSRTGTLSYGWGTSFSAPQVAGVCGLLAALRPDLTHEQARQLLCAGAEDQVGDATDTAGFDNYHGWGRLNAYHSLLLGQMQLDPPTNTAGTATFTWTSPANASNKQPIQIQSCDAPDAGWGASWTTNGIFYATNRSAWSDTNAWTGPRFYRLELRPLP